MSAELTTRNGVAETFSVRETPWHREGHILTAAPDFETALRLAGHEFEVVKLPAFIRTPGVDPMLNSFTESAKAFVTVRTDTGQELGSVGPDYTPCQNREAFRVLTPLLDQGLAALETGGSLREGADVWLMAKFEMPEGELAAQLLPELGVTPYCLVANNHAGRRGVLVSLNPVRVVCANTLGAAEVDGLARSIVVRHTGDVAERVEQAARDLFLGIVERYNLAAQHYRDLMRMILDPVEFTEYVIDPAIPDPRHNPRWNPEARMASAVVARYERKVAEVTRLWDEGAGHTGNHSAWEAYNGLVEAMDHNTELWPTRGGVYRTASMLDGQIFTTKQRVFEGLVRAAGSLN